MALDFGDRVLEHDYSGVRAYCQEQARPGFLFTFQWWRREERLARGH